MNKRSIALLSFFLFLTTHIFSQQSYWEEIYTNQGNDTAVDIVDNQDGTYTIIGEAASSGIFNDKNIWIYSIDENGQIIWEQTIGNPNEGEVPKKIIRFNNEYWVIASNATYRIDLQGNIIATIDIPDAFDIIPNENNTSVLLLTVATPEPLGQPRVEVINVDVDGNIVSSFILEDDQISGKLLISRRIIVTSDNNYLIVASNFNKYEDTFYKVTPTGTILWKKVYNWGIYGEPTDLFETSAGDFLVAGFYVFEGNLNDHAYLLDTNGDLIWQNRYNISNDTNGFKGTATNDGNYVFASVQIDTTTQEKIATTFKINTTGDKVWQETYPFENENLQIKLQNVIETTSSDLIMVGTQVYDPNNRVAVAIRTDAEGQILISCSNKRIDLNTQAEVDAWPDCIEANEIWISGDDITDLSPLSTLVRAYKLVISSCPNLQNLNGLQNLTTIDTTLVIINDTSLTDISALSNLTTSKGLLYLSGLTALPSLDGLQNLTTTSNVYIERNTLLENFDELQGIQEIDALRVHSHQNLTNINLPNLQSVTSLQTLQVIDNAHLTTISGLENVQTIEASAVIAANEILPDMTWLSGLQTVTDLFVVASNNGIQTLNGLEQLTSIGGSFELSNNPILLEVDALRNLNNVTGNLNFLDNTSLQSCCGLYPLLAEGTVGSYNISGNALCNSIFDILFECQPDDCNAKVTLTSQAEVDAYIGCTDIAEILTIDGDDIVDLSPLSSLQSIGSELKIINNQSLTSLAGLNNIQSIGLRIVLENNPILTDISALNNLERLQGRLTIRNNNSLTSLEGFNNLKEVHELIISENDSLTDLSAFNNLTTIGLTTNNGYFVIGDNNSLTSINSFNKLTYVKDRIVIGGNQSLETIGGFNNFTDVRYALAIIDNPVLKNLDGFEGLTKLGFNHNEISDNPQLENLDALSNVLNVYGSLTVENNTSLTDCCGIYPLLNEGTVTFLNILNNPSPCSNQAQVLSFCDDGVLDGVDLRLDITADRTEYAIYRDIVYTVSVTNEGTADATNVQVSIPKATGFNGGLVFTGFRNLTDQNINYQTLIGRINIPIVPVGETLEFELVLFPLIDDAPIDLFGQIIAQDLPDIDSINDFDQDQIPDEDDESLVTLTPVTSSTPFADLEIYMTADMPFASVGDEVTYTVSVTNKGETDATGVRVSHFNLFGQNYLTHTTNTGSYENINQLWEIGDIAVGNTVMLNITTVINSFPLLDNIKTAAFQIQTADQNDRDSSPGNGFTYNFEKEDDEVEFKVQELSNDSGNHPDLELNLAVDNTEYTKFSYVTYTLTVTNTGTVDATGVKIDWQEPEGLAFHEAIISNGRFYSWSGEWFIDTPIAAGASESIVYTLWTNVGGVPITSYAQVVQMNEPDADSFVGNGICCVANEDDEAAITVGGNNINTETVLGLHTQNDTPATLETKAITHRQVRKIEVHNVYPNPATDYVNLGISTTINNAVPFSVYNASGILVKNGQLAANDFYQEHRLNIENLPAGLYVVRFHTGEDHAPVRFLKQQL